LLTALVGLLQLLVVRVNVRVGCDLHVKIENAEHRKNVPQPPVDLLAHCLLKRLGEFDLRIVV